MHNCNMGEWSCKRLRKRFGSCDTYESSSMAFCLLDFQIKLLVRTSFDVATRIIKYMILKVCLFLCINVSLSLLLVNHVVHTGALVINA